MVQNIPIYRTNGSATAYFLPACQLVHDPEKSAFSGWDDEPFFFISPFPLPASDFRKSGLLKVKEHVKHFLSNRP